MNPVSGIRVAITGAAGMVGSAIAWRLTQQDVDVRAHAGPAGTDVGLMPEGVQTSFADIADRRAIATLVRGADAVIHVAGPPSVAASFASPAAYAHAHATGTANVLEACRAEGVRRLVHISSAEVYGQPSESPVTEDAATVPRSPYGAAKLGGESLVRAFCPPAGIAAVVLRPFSVYGPMSPERSLVGRLLRSALDDDVVELASLRPVRDYVHVDDVAAATSAALTVATARRAGQIVSVYNVASGEGTSVADLAALVLSASGRAARVTEAHASDRPAATDIDELVADISRAASDLGWSPAVPLKDGLASALRVVIRQRSAATRRS